MADGAAIKEGFICPMCLKDLRTPNNLLTHFQDQHSEEQDILKSIKDMYGKAKKKILKLEDQDLQTFKEQTREVYFLEQSLPQEVGPFRSHTDYLKDLRREKLDHRTTETNRLIIRLDRLLRTFGPDRKQQEQELVEWLDGSAVTRCPSCAASFNIARRQHHCRLCGSIMCQNCSFFLPYDQAYRIVAPINNTSDRDFSGKETDTLRICDHCLKMLQSRQRVQINQMLKPTIWQLYSLLEKNRKQVQSFLDLYNKMYDSLTSGETTFLLHDLQSLRSSIAEKAQIIDTLSKKIASEPVDPEMPKAALVQNNIRKATANYIKDCLLIIPQPPSAEEIENIREKLAMSFREESVVEPRGQPKIQTVAVTTGWSPAPANIESRSQDEDDNPLKEQMSIVKNYIDQARKAQRYEEVASLEENLKMLQQMYRQQRTALV